MILVYTSCLRSATIAIALSSILLCVGPAPGLKDGRIGVLYVGCVARSQPFWVMRPDPLFSMRFVQATIRDFMMYGPMPAKTDADACGERNRGGLRIPAVVVDAASQVVQAGSNDKIRWVMGQPWIDHARTRLE